ncbi:transcriptional coactivator p15/PC4 family protein [Defluviimonas aestuarii]|uniref:transcriptional coactivator p15/PC4 family protein n=1 Tax=Albidovulum aestuarii TaxID=1130726 RepID=UPI00249C5A97|nr:transcriptional coactivator p15/PC4 family protein [Defluviimonas aestuarii]MDI3336649.1 transcriptional coactivator p15/PC4 family protein [Defluviimonas aestuarii]
MHIATIPKNAREEFRVEVQDYKGHRLLNIRVWFDDGSGEYSPGKQGIALRLDLLSDLCAALEKAAELEGAA